MFLEDAGFDWKILGPDVSNLEYVAWVCDNDAYACSGQKCSAQSILFMHQNWAQAGKHPLFFTVKLSVRSVLGSPAGPRLARLPSSVLEKIFKLAHVSSINWVQAGILCSSLTIQTGRAPSQPHMWTGSTVGTPVARITNIPACGAQNCIVPSASPHVPLVWQGRDTRGKSCEAGNSSMTRGTAKVASQQQQNAYVLIFGAQGEA